MKGLRWATRASQSSLCSIRVLTFPWGQPAPVSFEQGNAVLMTLVENGFKAR
ncbi:Hypothetical protein A7982_07278 [Minicystis rosea]|nr:Hypothetical protein A7982_07278 [Minicystis rosea]